MSNSIEILIAEESRAESAHLKHILEQHGHKATIEHNGQLALANVRANRPQIVISAVMLPLMDGYALCREIKADEALKDIPVILLTSLSDTTDIIRGMECGADNFITKPYDEELLMSRIEHIVLNRELRAGATTQVVVDVVLGGEKYSITPERQQIVDLLISTYELAVQKNLELMRVQKELNALNERLEEKIEERTTELKAEVAEHLASQSSLKKQQGFLSDVIDTNPNPVFVKDLQGRFTLVNKAMAGLYGTTPAAMVGKTDMDFNVKKDEVERILRHDNAVIETAQRIHIPEEPITDRKTGEVSWFQTVRTPLIKSNGEVHQVLGIATDITARKQAEMLLKESEDRYRDLVENSHDLICTHDLEGQILSLNQAVTNVLGYDRKSLLNQNIRDILSPEFRVGFDKYLAEIKKEGVAHGVMTIKTRSGENRIWEYHNSLRTEGVEVPIVRGLATDITERKQAEQALIESEDRLQQSQKMESIGTLTGGVAHDFNNLLTAILGNTQLALRKLAPDDPLQQRLLEIERAGNRAAALTRQLLAFSRRQHLERKTINLNDTISEIMKLLQRIIGADVEMRVKYTPNLLATFADPVQIEQVIMNLCTNARDAMPHGGTLIIETSNIVLDESYRHQYPYVQPGKYVQISVSDTGVGMAEEIQARIFEPFFTTKEIGKGTGLGLSMAYGIIKQHDGYINVYSGASLGTTFKIFLPVDESAVEKEMPSVQLSLLGGTETILVAEDEEALQNLARNILEGLGYKILMAKNGEEAVEMFTQYGEHIDMLLFDVVMPRMGGLEAYERIRELGGKMPSIFMTGYSSETVQNQFVKQDRSVIEIDAQVIQKPYGVESIGRKVREVLDKHSESE